MDKKNVLILTMPDANAGVSNHTNYLNNLLKKTDYNPVLMKHWGEKLIWEERKKGYSLCVDNKEVDFDYSIYPVLEKIKKNNLSPEILHIHTTTYEADGSFDIIKDFFKKPVVYTLHSVLKYRLANDKMKIDFLNGGQLKTNSIIRKRAKFQESLLEKSDKLVLISETDKKVFDKIYPQYASKAFPIPNFTNFYEFMENDKERIIQKGEEIRKKYQKEGGELFVYCGRIEKQKNSRTLIEHWNAIAEKYPKSRLLLVGGIRKGEKEKDLINSLHRKYGLNQKNKKSISATEWIKNPFELACYLRAGDALIHPMVIPNLYSLTCLETICVDRPIISCQGELSFGDTLTKENTLEAIARLKNPVEVKKYLDDARRIINEKYSEEHYTRKIAGLYDIISEGKNFLLNFN
jgi:glycosyltransferase involved in cell wall biosynthesis